MTLSHLRELEQRATAAPWEHNFRDNVIWLPQANGTSKMLGWQARSCDEVGIEARDANAALIVALRNRAKAQFALEEAANALMDAERYMFKEGTPHLFTREFNALRTALARIEVKS